MHAWKQLSFGYVAGKSVSIFCSNDGTGDASNITGGSFLFLQIKSLKIAQFKCTKNCFLCFELLNSVTEISNLIQLKQYLHTCSAAIASGLHIKAAKKS